MDPACHIHRVELSESTIRTTLFRAYKKLGIEDKAGLAVFAERFEILD